MVLTDEQVAEGLALAAQGTKEDPQDFMALLALALRERVERLEARVRELGGQP
jgi:hypothetical protein